MRIILSTFGSLGDIHPFIAIALGLRIRGHSPIIATSEFYRQKIEKLGLDFRSVRPDIDRTISKTGRLMDHRMGSVRFIRERLVGPIRESYEDLSHASMDADLIITHPMLFAVRLVAEKRGIPWVSTAPCPIIMPTAYDPSLAPPFYLDVRPLGPTVVRAGIRLVKVINQSWFRPIHVLREEIGLPAVRYNPLVEPHSPHLILALFSKWLADRQPDWPDQTIQTGFPFFDESGDGPAEADSCSRLRKFLDNGRPPLVFTLGSAASWAAGDFYKMCIEASEKLKMRAVLLLGSDERNQLGQLHDSMLALSYAPFSELFPRSAAIINHGGAGTIGQAMRAGRPMLVVPFSHDQPDNAHRASRQGVARTLRRNRLSAGRLVEELQKLLNDKSYTNQSAAIAKKMAEEDGVTTACDAIQSLIDRARILSKRA